MRYRKFYVNIYCRFKYWESSPRVGSDSPQPINGRLNQPTTLLRLKNVTEPSQSSRNVPSRFEKRSTGFYRQVVDWVPCTFSPRPCGGGEEWCTLTPLIFFSEMAAEPLGGSRRNFAYLMRHHLRSFWQKKLSGSGQVTWLLRHKKYGLRPIFQRNRVFSHVTCCHWQEWWYYAWFRSADDIWPFKLHLDLSKVIRGHSP